MSQDNKRNQNALIQTVKGNTHQIDSKQTQDLKPLNLSPQKLLKRIKSLKNYQTYQSTKIQRIQSDDQQMSKSPILNTVTQLGKKRNQNPVLCQYLNEQTSQNKPYVQKAVHNKLQDKLKQLKKVSQTPKFISFKLQQKGELSKVAKMLKNRSQQLYEPLLNYAKSEQRTNRVSETINITPFPKELTKLQRRLKLIKLPITRRFTTDYSSQHDSECQKSEKFSKSMSKRHLDMQPVQRGHINSEITPRLNNIQSIQRVNVTFLRLSRQKISNSKQSSFSKRYQGAFREKIEPIWAQKTRMISKVDEIIGKNGINNQKSDARWPQYSQFSRSDKDQRQINKLMRKFKRQTQKSIQISQPLYNLQLKIQKQFQVQQRELDQSLLGERSPLGEKYNHYLQLQKQAYQRNLKDLRKYKMQYQAQGQRHLIWANGIKRLKKY